jgi:hypothetical protein
VTFKEKYYNESRWPLQVAVIELYHFAKLNRYRSWTQLDTAKYFEISVATVNENLKLADALHTDISLEHISRNKALRMVRYGKKKQLDMVQAKSQIS